MGQTRRSVKGSKQNLPGLTNHKDMHSQTKYNMEIRLTLTPKNLCEHVRREQEVHAATE